MNSNCTVRYGNTPGQGWYSCICDKDGFKDMVVWHESGTAARNRARALKAAHNVSLMYRKDEVRPDTMFRQWDGQIRTVIMWASENDRMAANGNAVKCFKDGLYWCVRIIDGKTLHTVKRWSCASYHDAVKLAKWVALKIGTEAKIG